MLIQVEWEKKLMNFLDFNRNILLLVYSDAILEKNPGNEIIGKQGGNEWKEKSLCTDH